MEIMVLGILTPIVIYAVITGLYYFLPGRWVTGYVTHTKTGEKLRYRLNGRLVLITCILLWAFLGMLNLVPFDWLYTVRYYSLASAFIIGLIFSIVIVFPTPSTGKPLLTDFYLGRLDNPQFNGGKFDIKMWLYLIGAVMLELNILSFTSYHYITYGSASSPGVFLYAALFSYFLFDYLTFEEVHLYTYDIFAEKVGFKLGWGCLTFYPFFYSISLFTTAHLPNPETPLWILALYSMIFFAGWTIARGANMQKFYFKTQPQKAFLGIKPQTLTDGNKTLLVNGFWGLSRHINYLGELLMATGIALSVGYPTHISVWLYPLFYVALFIPRQIDDDKRCAAKYGKLWDQYVSKIKYRIIPFLY